MKLAVTPVTPEVTLYRAERLSSTSKMVDFATSKEIALSYGGEGSKIVELKLTRKELDKLSFLDVSGYGERERFIYHVPQDIYQKATIPKARPDESIK